MHTGEDGWALRIRNAKLGTLDGVRQVDLESARVTRPGSDLTEDARRLHLHAVFPLIGLRGLRRQRIRVGRNVNDAVAGGPANGFLVVTEYQLPLECLPFLEVEVNKSLC